MAGEENDIRSALLEQLMGRVRADRYPSATMLDMIEQLLKPDEVPAYTRLLLDKAADDEFPSIPILSRVEAFAS